MWLFYATDLTLRLCKYLGLFPTVWYFGLPKYPKQPAVSYALDPTSRGAYAPYTPVELLVRLLE